MDKQNPKSLNNSDVKKSTPQSLEGEQSTLGAMLIDSEALEYGLESLEDTDFYYAQHQRIFRAFRELRRNKEAVDIFTLSQQLIRQGDLEEVGGQEYLHKLYEACQASANIKSYVKAVLDTSIRRKLIQASDKIAGLAWDDTEDVSFVMDGAEKSIFEVARSRRTSEFQSMSALAGGVFEMLKSRHLDPDKDKLLGVSSGLRDLDEMTAGLQETDLIIVAGRPGMGKTSFALGIAEHIAGSEGRSVGFFSLEMSKEQLIQRLIAMKTQANLLKLRRGRLGKDWDKVERVIGDLLSMPLHIDDSAALTTSEFMSRARRLKIDHPDLAVIVVDYVQLMRDKRFKDNKNGEIGEIIQTLKRVAKELKVAVIALSQLSRNVESREDKAPQLSDLRDSGALEAEADLVLFPYRPEYYEKKKREVKEAVDWTEPENAYIIIAKQRNGPLAWCKVQWIGMAARFVNMPYGLTPRPSSSGGGSSHTSSGTSESVIQDDDEDLLELF